MRKNKLIEPLFDLGLWSAIQFHLEIIIAVWNKGATLLFRQNLLLLLDFCPDRGDDFNHPASSKISRERRGRKMSLQPRLDRTGPCCCHWGGKPPFLRKWGLSRKSRGLHPVAEP